MAQVAEGAATRCASCAQPLTGRYCANCGEKVLDPHALTVRHFFTHTVAEELFHLDGRLWTTLRSLVMRPGFLSREYAEGRRRRYVNPVRLLISAIILYALLTQGGFIFTLKIGWVILSVAPTAVPATANAPETVQYIDRFGILSKMLDAKRASVDVTSELARDRFHRQLNQFAQPLSFTNVLLLAFALWVCFHRRRPLFVQHAVFSMHVVSFVLLSTLVLVPILRMVPLNDATIVLTLLPVAIWQFSYIAIALRRFYYGGGAATWRGRVYAGLGAIALYVVNSAFLTAVQMAAGALALRNL